MNLPVFKVGNRKLRYEQIHLGNPGYRRVKGDLLAAVSDNGFISVSHGQLGPPCTVQGEGRDMFEPLEAPK